MLTKRTAETNRLTSEGSNAGEKMDVVSHPSTWSDIERSESYLVCCMFDEAASLASSVLRQLCDNESTGPAMETIEFNDMLESAGMVFVQSLKELGRTPEIMKELKLLFGSVTAIPLQVFLTGVCFQIKEGPYDVREYLEEFLSMWMCVDDKYYVLATAEDMGSLKGCDNPFVLGADKYLEVVEVYVVTLLAMLLRDTDLAISWVEKAALPEKKRQELLRQLYSMYSDKLTSSSRANCLPLLADQNRTHTALKEENTDVVSSKVLEAQNPSSGNDGVKEAILKLSKKSAPSFWWFRTINLKFGNRLLVISNGSILLGCLLFLMYYAMRRKQDTLKRILRRQALNVKKVVTDLWQLAFSYQVNPLAAVQPLPPASLGSQ